MPAPLRQGEHHVEIDGVRQAYEVVGDGPVCLVHSGGPGFHSDYLRMPLLEERLTLVYLDPVGTRRSGPVPGGDYSIERYAHHCSELAAHLQVEKPYFLGHSHGGYVGLRLALRAPESLSGLILYSAAPVFGPELFMEAGRQADAFAARRPDEPEVQQARQRFWENLGPDAPPITDRDSFLDFVTTILPLYFNDFRRIVATAGQLPLDVTYDPARQPTMWDARDDLGSISTRTLIVSGAHDFICPPRWADQMHHAMSSARLVRLDGSGHFGHIEEPARFAEAVLDFTAR